MKSPQARLNRATLLRDHLRDLLPSVRKATSAAAILLAFSASVLIADTGLRLARELPDLMARAAAERAM